MYTKEIYSLIVELGLLLDNYNYQWSDELKHKFEEVTLYLSSPKTSVPLQDQKKNPLHLMSKEQLEEFDKPKKKGDGWITLNY